MAVDLKAVHYEKAIGPQNNFTLTFQRWDEGNRKDGWDTSSAKTTYKSSQCEYISCVNFFPPLWSYLFFVSDIDPCFNVRKGMRRC